MARKKTENSELKPIGRRPKTFDWDLFGKLCQIQCTEAELCLMLDVTDKTLNAICKREKGKSFSELYAQKAVDGKKSLRRKQFEVAMSGNCTMLIWLGKQYLDQSDKSHITNDSTEKLFEMFRDIK